MKLLMVEPTYGWGWFDSGTVSVPIPTPFALEVAVFAPGKPFQSAFGRLKDAGHPLDGMWVWLCRRSAAGDGAYILRAFRERPFDPASKRANPAVTGYAEAREVPEAANAASAAASTLREPVRQLVGLF